MLVFLKLLAVELPPPPSFDTWYPLSVSMKKSLRFLARACFLEAEEAATAWTSILFCELLLFSLSFLPLVVVKKSSTLRVWEADGLTQAEFGRNYWGGATISLNLCRLSQL